MTARDVVWLLATLMFVGGCLTLAWCWWRIRPARRVLYIYDGPMILRGPAHVLDQVQWYRIVPRPPYDWERDGD